MFVGVQSPLQRRAALSPLLVACDSHSRCDRWQPLAMPSCHWSTLIPSAVCRTEGSLTCACDGGVPGQRRNFRWSGQSKEFLHHADLHTASSTLSLLSSRSGE